VQRRAGAVAARRARAARGYTGARALVPGRSGSALSEDALRRGAHGGTPDGALRARRTRCSRKRGGLSARSARIGVLGPGPRAVQAGERAGSVRRKWQRWTLIEAKENSHVPDPPQEQL